MPNEEFEKWRKAHGTELVTLSDKYAAKKGFDARQPEIDALKSENALLKETGRGIMDINAALKAEVDRLRADAERVRAEIGHMKKSVDHAWRMLEIANTRLAEHGLRQVLTDTPNS